jgi:hypothetical protein
MQRDGGLRIPSTSARPNSVFGAASTKRCAPSCAVALTMRRTCCCGVMPSTQAFSPARCASLVKASTGTPAARATGTTAAASALVSGPMMARAPSAIAWRAAAAAPAGEPAVSRGRNSTPLGASSNSAMVAAFSIA